MSQRLKVREQALRSRLRIMSWVIALGLFVAGVTAIPLETELDFAARLLKASDLSPDQASSGFVKWVLLVREGVHATNATYPFIFYGTDWLAFAHIVLGIAFLRCVNHPLRNAWLFTLGMIACVMVAPWALIMGEVRGIPIGWRLIDCCFGVLGFVPCWLCVRWTREMQQIKMAEASQGFGAQ
jgi:hypothetical protein